MGRITFAVIAAGGFGTRLKPFTDTAPKPMLPVLGKPLLEWHVEQFKKHGVTDFVFTLHYLPEIIQGYFGDGSRFGVNIEYVVEKGPLGSGGSLRRIDSLPERFFYIYGDMLSLVDYGAMQDLYAKKSTPLGMQRVALTENYGDADVAELNAEGAFTAVHRKPHRERYERAYRMRGIFILEREITNYIPEGFADVAKDVLPNVIASGKHFYGYESEDYSKGIDTLDKLREVEMELIKRGFSSPQ
jgi:mannose-1-phosphate guanylyltransferase/phosphomannomutase